MSEQVLSFLYVACSTVCWMSVRAMIRDKKVAGVSIIPSFIFLATNSYEVWYFANRHQPFAALGAVSMVASNLIWTALAIRYRLQALVFGSLT